MMVTLRPTLALDLWISPHPRLILFHAQWLIAHSSHFPPINCSHTLQNMFANTGARRLSGCLPATSFGATYAFHSTQDSSIVFALHHLPQPLSPPIPPNGAALG